MLISVQKDIWVQEILLLEVLVMCYGGGGSKLKVQGTDSYPVNECVSIYIYIASLHVCMYTYRRVLFNNTLNGNKFWR